MKRVFLLLFIMLTALVGSSEAQFFTSETARKAGERMEKGDLAKLDSATRAPGKF